MTTQKTTHSQAGHNKDQDKRTSSHTTNRDDDSAHGKQGFASMPKEEVQEIASKGGQSHGTSHKNEDTKASSHPSKAHSTHNTENNDKNEDNREHGKQGFASMPHDKVVEIARKGGQHSHDNDGQNKDDNTERSSARK